MFVANYTGGSVAVLPLSDDGHVGPAADSKYHTGTLLPSLVDRQESAHPHSIYQDPYVHKVMRLIGFVAPSTKILMCTRL